VAHLSVPGSEVYRKLAQLKSEKGGLTSQDERHFAQIRRSLEAEVLAHADVVSARTERWRVWRPALCAVRVPCTRVPCTRVPCTRVPCTRVPAPLTCVRHYNVSCAPPPPSGVCHVRRRW
jgi:hypothetical protein